MFVSSLIILFFGFHLFGVNCAKIVVVGASGNLGSELVRRALSAGHEITAVVRDRTKLTAMFPNVEMNIITADTSTISHQNMNTFKGIFTGQDVAIEVLSNDQRPLSINMLIEAAESSNLPAFFVCGGAGLLLESLDHSDALRVYENPTVQLTFGSWLVDVSRLHLNVQQQVFSSKVPMVTQICPPGMVLGAATGKALASMDLSAAVWELTYADVADVIIQSITDDFYTTFNRRMMGFKLNRRVITVLGSDGKVRKTSEMGERKASEAAKHSEHIGDGFDL